MLNRFARSAIWAAATLVGACGAGAACAGDFDQASSYSVGMGMAPGEENMGANGSTRDANGNRVFINGVAEGMANPVTDMAAQFSGGNPNGTTSGVGSYGQATAIGNNLDVQVSGMWNTVIVNSTQINKGDQSASLNGKIKF